MARKPKQPTHFSAMVNAFDLLLSGSCHTVIGNDFIIKHRDPYNADIGHLDPSALQNYDQVFIDEMISTQAVQSAETATTDWLAQLQEYREQRQLLCQYQGQAEKNVFEQEEEASRELGNYDHYLDKIVARNEAEMHIFYDYMALYRKTEGKRMITEWRSKNPKAINKKNQSVVKAYEAAKFSVLRLDKHIAYGATRVTNIVTQEESILMDKALYDSRKEGCFFICSLLDRGHYVMSSGGGVIVKSAFSREKSALTLLKKHWSALKTSKRALNNDIAECAREVYGFCLRSGIMEYMTIQ